MSTSVQNEIVVLSTVNPFDINNDEDFAFISADVPLTFTQTDATTTATVPTVTASNPPAGGVGNVDESGCYDTAQHRDDFITALTAEIADETVNRQLINAIINCLVAGGVAARAPGTVATPNARMPYEVHADLS